MTLNNRTFTLLKIVLLIIISIFITEYKKVKTDAKDTFG